MANRQIGWSQEANLLYYISGQVDRVAQIIANASVGGVISFNTRSGVVTLLSADVTGALGYTPEQPLTFSSPLSRSTNTISIQLATSSVNGYLSSTDWSTFNGKQGAITLTTTGTSGAATLVGNTLNIPQYSGGGGSGTVTSVAMTVPTGFTISGSPITTSGTLALTLTAGYSIPTTASQTNWDSAYTNRITSITNTGNSGNSTISSNTLNVPDYSLISFNRQTASYVLVLGDRGKMVEMNVATANTLTIPPNSSVAYPIGTEIEVTQYGAGATTITAGAGVTIRSLSGYLKLGGQYVAVSLIKVGTDEWYCFGNTIA